MKKTIRFSPVLLLWLVCFFGYIFIHKDTSAQVENDKKVEVIEVLTPQQIDLKQRQEVWISALEWCESRGKNNALNKRDRDGTPSYSNFQWKPGTLLYYGKKYGLVDEGKTIKNVPELLKDYELQRNIIRNMVQDKDVNWYHEFPDCVKLKVGMPPKT